MGVFAFHRSQLKGKTAAICPSVSDISTCRHEQKSCGTVHSSGSVSVASEQPMSSSIAAGESLGKLYLHQGDRILGHMAPSVNLTVFTMGLKTMWRWSTKHPTYTRMLVRKNAVLSGLEYRCCSCVHRWHLWERVALSMHYQLLTLVIPWTSSFTSHIKAFYIPTKQAVSVCKGCGSAFRSKMDGWCAAAPLTPI